MWLCLKKAYLPCVDKEGLPLLIPPVLNGIELRTIGRPFSPFNSPVAGGSLWWNSLCWSEHLLSLHVRIVSADNKPCFLLLHQKLKNTNFFTYLCKVWINCTPTTSFSEHYMTVNAENISSLLILTVLFCSVQLCSSDHCFKLFIVSCQRRK